MNTNETIIIDGSVGEGGGQIFRTSLSLAMCLGKTICIENIRAKRSKPGLLRQHLTCLKAAREICDADVDGEHLGAQRVVFKPGKIKAGHYHFAVGSAGSSTLIFQTILMPLLLASKPSQVTLEGGTHNGMAPSFDFIEQSFLPVLKTLGCEIKVELKDYGFYPAGGGKWQVDITPCSAMKKLDLIECGQLLAISATATLSKLPRHIAERELKQIAERCQLSEQQLYLKKVSSVGPGNVISLAAKMESGLAMFEAFAEKKLPAEKVADKAIDDFKAFQLAQVPVCEHLADQLIVPMALGAGGRFRTLSPSMHLQTNIEVVNKIMNRDIQLKALSDLVWEVVVSY